MVCQNTQKYYKSTSDKINHLLAISNEALKKSSLDNMIEILSLLEQAKKEMETITPPKEILTNYNEIYTKINIVKNKYLSTIIQRIPQIN